MTRVQAELKKKVQKIVKNLLAYTRLHMVVHGKTRKQKKLIAS